MAAATGASALALAVLVATALFGFSAGAAATDLGAPDRSSVPAEVSHSLANALPSDSTSVRIAMTENNGLDVIVQSLGGVSAPGVANAAAVRFRQTAGTWAVDTGPGCAGPWTQVGANQSTPTASPVSGGLLQLCVASGNVLTVLAWPSEL